jgi:hypothetical protein
MLNENYQAGKYCSRAAKTVRWRLTESLAAGPAGPAGLAELAGLAGLAGPGEWTRKAAKSILRLD